MTTLDTAPGDTATGIAPSPALSSDASGFALTVDGLTGGFRGKDGEIRPVLRSVSFGLPVGQMTAIVGETGSGKSLTATAMLQIQPRTFVRTAGTIRLGDVDLFEADQATLRAVRGSRIAMVFQDARAALNPVFTLGRQIADVVRLGQSISAKEAAERAVDLLKQVRISDPGRRAGQYPHEISGGMAQRAMLAMALAAEPDVLVLDEPTTGLDVTIQADIMDLIVTLTRERSMTVSLVTHDMGLVAETCDHVVVLYHGEIKETGTAEQIFTRPADDYTQRLLTASRVLEVRP